MNHFRLSALLAIGLFASACAPSVLSPAQEVKVTSNSSLLSRCLYLGPVVDDRIVIDAEPEPDDVQVEVTPTEGLLQATSDVGGDTIIVTAAGAGEAYYCSGNHSPNMTPMEPE